MTRIRVFAVVALTVVAMAIPASAPPAMADHPAGTWPASATGFSNCAWDQQIGIRWRTTDFAIPNGEFRARILESIDSWEDGTAFPETQMVYLGESPDWADTRIRYVPQGHSGLLGSTLGYTWFVIAGSQDLAAFGFRWLNHCSPAAYWTSSSTVEIRSGIVYMARRNDWFTRPAADRGYWERLNCRQNSSAPYGWEAYGSSATRGTPEDNYLCSRRYDFQSVFTHELGHLLGMHHPQSIDDYRFANTTSWVAEHAYCGDPGRSRWQRRDATMCNITPSQTTFGRTPDAYDHDSARFQVSEN